LQADGYNKCPELFARTLRACRISHAINPDKLVPTIVKYQKLQTIVDKVRLWLTPSWRTLC
jgi:putative SOS response-associated peptidase YedK